MTFAPHQEYHAEDSSTLLVLFDLRDPEVAPRLHREWAAWGGQEHIEVLDAAHFALLVQAGGVRRIAE